MRRLAALYSTAAGIALGALLVLATLNLLALPFVRSADDPPAIGEEQMTKLERVYPDMSSDEIRSLVAETRTRPYMYEPFTQFRERPHRGRFYTVEAEGYRRSEPQAAWPPSSEERSLFVFGGSTAFGYGLPDAETIPSQLARALAAGGCSTAVYNFGRSNYYSSQERILFQQLVAGGQVPDAAVFFDGLNEFLYADDAPKFTLRLTHLMDESGLQLARRALVRLPLVRLIRQQLPDRDQRAELAPPSPEMAAAVIERWLNNRRMSAATARELGVHALFVWQPVPDYGYDLDRHLFAGRDEDLTALGQLLAEGYRRMAAARSTLAGGDFLWLADLQRGRAEPLYVDRFHYTAAFSGEIAAAIAAAVAPALCPVDSQGPPS